MSFKREFKDASVLCITETWLDPFDPGHSSHGPGLFRADRCPVLSQKEKGGGVCFLVNQRWCNDAKLVSQSCSVELETLIINCRPFYSPREFSSVVLVGVYMQTPTVLLLSLAISITRAPVKCYQDTNSTWTVQHAKTKHLTTVTRYTKEHITPVPVLH